MKRGAKPIRYQDHAIRRMRQRSISEAQVERVVRTPDADRPAARKGAVRLEKKVSARRRITVVIEEDQHAIWVVSA